MKLRIRGNSLRIRVSQGELAELSSTGFASDSVRFSPETELSYCLEVRPDSGLEASFSDASIKVVLPQVDVTRWIEPEQVSIEGKQALGDGEVLSILVEKDFTCLAPREGEDESDLFANPSKT